MQSERTILQPVFLVFTLCLLFSTLKVNAQPPLLRNFEYVESYSLTAVEQMLEFGIPASVTLAQAILESGSGTSSLARRSNNHFGIKCHLEWKGDTILQTDDTLGECFRSYPSTLESYQDHSRFLRSRARYAALFQLPITDYKSWCLGLKSAGYATFPNYAEVLISIIDNLNLHELDGVHKLQPKQFILQHSEELKSSALSQNRPGLYQLAENRALFADERDVHLRSVLLHAQSN